MGGSASSSSTEAAAATQTTLQAWRLARRDVLQEDKVELRRESVITGSRVSTWGRCQDEQERRRRGLQILRLQHSSSPHLSRHGLPTQNVHPTCGRPELCP